MINNLIEIVHHAGNIIISIYNKSEQPIFIKDDHSPLTKADTESNKFIHAALTENYPTIPIISEESEQQPYALRKDWPYFFMIDPLDGTKEFIQKNGEFTINLSLMKNNKPIIGIIHAPALALTYYAEKGKGAYKIYQSITTKLTPGSQPSDQLRIAISRSHVDKQTTSYIRSLHKSNKEVIIHNKGSALKFGLIAEGNADVYPRFGTTMEWDTAAGQIIVNEVGKKVKLMDSDSELQYNKNSLKNPYFIVS